MTDPLDADARDRVAGAVVLAKNLRDELRRLAIADAVGAPTARMREEVAALRRRLEAVRAGFDAAERAAFEALAPAGTAQRMAW